MNQRALLGSFQTAASVWRQRPALHVRANDFRIDGEGVDINVGHDGVKVHTGAMFWQFNGNDAFRLTMFKQCLRQELDTLRRSTFRHADQHAPRPITSTSPPSKVAWS